MRIRRMRNGQGDKENAPGVVINSNGSVNSNSSTSTRSTSGSTSGPTGPGRMFRRKKGHKQKQRRGKAKKGQDDGDSNSNVAAEEDGAANANHINPDSVPHFSSYSEMTIFHNSTVPDSSDASIDLASSSPPASPTATTSSYVASRTKSVMRFALQSRMYEEPKVMDHHNSIHETMKPPLPQSQTDELKMDSIDEIHSTDTPYCTSFSSSRDGYGYCNSSNTSNNTMNGYSNSNNNNNTSTYEKHWENLCDDPTVEESIECVFGHQLEDGLEIDMSVVDEDDDSMHSHDLMDHHHHHAQGNSHSMDGSIFGHVPMKRYSSGKLIQVGSFSPIPRLFGKNKNRESDHYEDESVCSSREESGNGIGQRQAQAHGTGCPTGDTNINNDLNDKESGSILMSPQDWPQSPLLLMPTPGSGTHIRGVRYADSTEYITDRTCKNKWWDETLMNKEQNKGKDGSASASASASVTSQSSTSSSDDDKYIFSDTNCPCPINNGNEEPGKTLVIDFESNLFQGTMQIRIRHSRGVSTKPYDDTNGYFHGFNRQYQSVVQGRFKKEGIPMNQCVVGQTFSRPIKPPAPYVAKAAFKVMRFFAPRLIASIDSHKPHVLSPLGSTPQTLIVDSCDNDERLQNGEFKANASISKSLSEPIEDSRRLVPCGKYASTLPSSAARAKARKKVFDKLCADNDDSITFRTDKIYTFEFLQHLMNFEKLEVGLGSMLGKMKLAPILDGQPMNLQAACQLTFGKEPTFEPLWSFDLWHESIIHDQK